MEGTAHVRVPPSLDRRRCRVRRAARDWMFRDWISRSTLHLHLRRAEVALAAYLLRPDVQAARSRRPHSVLAVGSRSTARPPERILAV